MLQMAEIDTIAQEIGFHGVVFVNCGDRVEFAQAYGLANREQAVPNTLDTRFAIADGAIGFTALTVMSLIEDGLLTLSTTARSVLGTDCPEIGDAVRVEDLLAQPTPAQDQLALIAERVGGASFEDLVRTRVTGPAGMRNMHGSDAGTALGYVKDGETWRSKVSHDDMYATASDFSLFWPALFAGEIVPKHWVADMMRPRTHVPENSARYGLGFWIHESKDIVSLEGFADGASFRSVHNPQTKRSHTVVANNSDGAQPLTYRLASLAPYTREPEVEPVVRSLPTSRRQRPGSPARTPRQSPAVGAQL
jgi:CubicO group peptidase (beta-lactamase class C family)